VIAENSDKNIALDILLVYSPFGVISSPYIGIPVLASYLKQKGFKVTAYDINREFLFRFLSPENIRKGLTFISKRFDQLNRQKSLNFMEINEYWLIVSLLLLREGFESDIKNIVIPYTSFDQVQNSKAVKFFTLVASMPNFPEIISTKVQLEKWSEFNHFSTQDILRSTEKQNIYSDIFRGIIADHVQNNPAPKAIGFSVVFQHQIIGAFQCAKIYREVYPDTHIVMGGPSISNYFRELKEIKLFDIVDSFIFDEGEMALENLLIELKKEKPDFTNVPNFLYRKNGSLVRNKDAHSLDLEQVPAPAYDVFDLDRYINSRDKLKVPFRLSKGCVWKKCSFCRTNLQVCSDFQQPSVDAVYNNLLECINKQKIKHFFFSDESADPLVLERISKRLIEDNIKIDWQAHTRVSTKLTRERCELFRKAGCNHLSMGIESFSDRILAMMKKGIDCKLIDRVFNNIKGVITVHAYMMVGFPTETEEEALHSHKILKEYVDKNIISSYSYTSFTLIYGSEIWNNLKEYGITDVRLPPLTDLSADSVDFSCTGLDRPRVFELFLDLSESMLLESKVKTLTQIQNNNQLIEINFDMVKLSQLVKNYSFMSLPKIQWLKENNTSISPKT